MKKKDDPFKIIRKSLTEKQLSFFFAVTSDRGRFDSIKSIGQDYFTSDAYTYKVLQKLCKLGLIDLTKGKKELNVETTTFGKEFIGCGDYTLTEKKHLPKDL